MHFECFPAEHFKCISAEHFKRFSTEHFKRFPAEHFKRFSTQHLKRFSTEHFKRLYVSVALCGCPLRPPERTPRASPSPARVGLPSCGTTR